MRKRGWLFAEPRSTPEQIQRAVQSFLYEASGITATAPLYRRSLTGLGVDEFEDNAKYAVLAWSARVFQKAKASRTTLRAFRFNSITDDFLAHLISQSKHDDGPKRAIQLLGDIGIQTVVEHALPGSLIDGAAFLAQDMQPIIGLTLRFDRVDYFWFTLLHEVAHIWKHLNTPNDGFIDRIDAADEGKRREQEANRIARDVLIPRDVWNRSAARIEPSMHTILDLAAELGIHPAIVAGRIHYESGQYGRFRSLMGQGTVKNQLVSHP
jgi:HTH-type transcriptional regulator/antitoxin HigA